MAPKKNKDTLIDPAAGLTEEQQAALQISQRLQAAAKSHGVLTGARRVTSQELPTPKLLLKADGKDLVKKSSQRKGRYLLNICAQIAPAAAGRLGSLAQLDSQNPVMYVDFPQGRLKFLGTIVFPKNKYMLLKFGQKDVLCEDIFENMIVFPEAHWIGTAEENPTEKELPMPAELQVPRHDKYSFGGAAHQTGTQPSQSQANVEDDHSDSDDMGDDEPGPSQPARISSRHKGKRPRYAEPGASGSDEDSIEMEDSDQEKARPQKLPKLSQQGTPSERKRRRSSGALISLPDSKAKPNIAKSASRAAVKRGVLASSSEDDDSDENQKDSMSFPAPAGKRAGKQATLSAFLSKSGSKAKVSSGQPSGIKATSGSKGKKKMGDVIDLLDEDDSSDSNGAGDDASQRKHSSPQPASVPRQQPRRARTSLLGSLKESSVSGDDIESQGSSDVEVQSAEEDDDDYQA
ncbi:hypothetical protein ABBQ32_011680 [Trebouxia sp. C0010 RCD-2024]